ncbi:hypothetical protein [Methylobacterium planeticum]|uniref:Uncharacterized protein n=1 Tax=Methylobacterium planeticum TaxID=2615211 RepID=A0A6N6MS30_9HYPH|nr:hypothetical protein [Methylobacterium planeticum]KAB1073656.1 hypothetical protein F6X51_10715 [Methylobacterium planeticum]
MLVGAVGGFLTGLAACENAVERQRVTLCRRAVPALSPTETDLAVLRAATGPAPDTVRVDYRTGTRPRWVLCRFNAGAELVGITTDQGHLNGAALYLLKRYYLDTPDAEASDPARADRAH